ncbi:toxin-antitoxin system HicB family antitoxin [Crenothrix sp.]|uniref:toxin-antitoxin system HicB family antitoxin n=1 Tax=Crenothrix sp. TaxID=3100433 RepID=UPI00374CE72A
MSIMTIRLADDHHERFKMLASRKGISLNKLFKEFSTRILMESDAESQFRLRAAIPDPTPAKRCL